MITVILNAFKRQKHIHKQIESVLNQSVQPQTVLVWNNGERLEIGNFDNKVAIANSSLNFGVWSRFSFALNADTEFVCILDDGTFPRERFFENCLELMKVESVLLGARDLRFLSSQRYEPFTPFGWDNSKYAFCGVKGS